MDQSSVSETPANAPIINGECPYVKNLPNKKIPSWAPSIYMMPKEVQDLFQRAFNYSAGSMEERIGIRATASEWCKALLKLAGPEPNPYLKQCSRNKMHVFPAAADSCPWCRCKEGDKKLPPPPPPFPPPLRPPGLYHSVVLIMGLASGFFFQAMISLFVYITAGRAAWGHKSGYCRPFYSRSAYRSLLDRQIH